MIVGHATKLKQPMVPPVIPNVIVQEDFHNKNWRAILLKWSSAGCYEELKNIVTREKFLPMSPGVHHEMQPEDTIDWVAMNFFPDDGPKNALPVSIYGDGKIVFPGQSPKSYLVLNNTIVKLEPELLRKALRMKQN